MFFDHEVFDAIPDLFEQGVEVSLGIDDLRGKYIWVCERNMSGFMRRKATDLTRNLDRDDVSRWKSGDIDIAQCRVAKCVLTREANCYLGTSEDRHHTHQLCHQIARQDTLFSSASANKRNGGSGRILGRLFGEVRSAHWDSPYFLSGSLSGPGFTKNPVWNETSSRSDGR